MQPENLQEALWILFAGAIGRQKRVASLVYVIDKKGKKRFISASAVNRWAHGDTPVTIQMVERVERLLGVYPVTEFLKRRAGGAEHQ